ncbi:MAG TPA: NAD(P)H-binding protein [Actinomycetota bacterium]|nr:NAD(P)H-binding protein [Actinomycetota bacterium]
MPVVVTGASGDIGAVLVPMLAQRGEVRALIRDAAAADPLRATGAKVAVADLADTATASTAMEGAHTVIHLAGGLDLPDERAYQAANLGTVLDALEAASEAEVTRFLLLSYPGASADSPNAYLRAKGLAEEAVRGSGFEHLILRSTHVYGPRQPWLDGMRAAASRAVAATVVGTGRQRIAPTYVEDVARTLVSGDDRAGAVEGTFGLQGPDEVTADELVDLLAGRRRRKVHLAPGAARKAARLLGQRLSLTMLEVLAMDSLADDLPSAEDELGVSLTPLREGLAASGVPVGVA